MHLVKWTKPELWAERQSHPYVAATGMGVDPRFKNEFQQRVYHELLMTKSKKFAPHKQVNTESLRDNDHLYPGDVNFHIKCNKGFSRVLFHGLSIFEMYCVSLK